MMVQQGNQAINQAELAEEMPTEADRQRSDRNRAMIAIAQGRTSLLRRVR
jgi:hypothetical protein